MAVSRSGGTIRRRDLLVLVPRRRIDAALAAGDLVQPVRGWISLPGARDAADLARHHGAVLGGLSAARHWNWKVKHEAPRPVLVVPRNRSRRIPGALVLRRDMDPRHVDGIALSRHATVLHCALTLPFDQALTVADSALRRPDVDPGLLLELATALPRARDRVLRVVGEATGEAANPFESVARAIALDVPGLHVVAQGPVGNNEHSDLVDHHLRIAIECDSWAWHGNQDAWRKDVHRYTRMTLDGWLVVRLLWHDVMHRPGAVRAQLSAAVALARRTRRNTFPP